MAVLTNAELTWLRRRIARKFAEVPWNKTEINDALQAVEDYFETTAKAGLNGAIETASPGVFTGPQKTMLVAYYILGKAAREGAD